ncbi:GSCFA domain-containing protein [Primorskyibacter sp. 2E107]|uniref:GSCFA domain-containing protein n=1 Tax=Primorskyibacter sp. 2E107 TaxID=3403458 RepID=UPI003AF78FA9
MSHPYKDLPAKHFWRKAIADVPRHDVMLPVNSSFKIAPEDKVATAGSCFAQHLAKGLEQAGFRYFVPEDGAELTPEQRAKENYGVFSARYGNIYTTLQLHQTLLEAYGEAVPQDRVWQGKDGRFYDPYRPAIQPGGFESEAAVLEARETMLAAVRRIVEDSDIFVFTLGLTEGWRNTADGWAYPVVPGSIAGAFDPDKHEFFNMTFREVQEALEASLAIFRKHNPTIRVLLTVSPVPLVATYEDRHVLTATTYSKSVLRAVVEETARAHDWVTYFPSYEIITGHYNGGLYFEEDMRNVAMRGVRHVMQNFMQEMTNVIASSKEMDAQLAEQFTSELTALDNLVCEGEALDS